MKRTTISLPDDTAARLDREAHRTGRSVSEVVRLVLIEKLGSEESPTPVPFAALVSNEKATRGADLDAVLAAEWGAVLDLDR
jgi:plasmid stability protein